MVGSADSDVLMYLVQTEGGQPVAAESTSSLTGNDARLMNGFVAGRYFEVEDFSFSLHLKDDEGTKDADTGQQGSYASWRALKNNQPKPDRPFTAEPQDVVLTRQIDSASPELLSSCLNTKRFHRAVIVKRARIGTTGQMSGILRMEFEDVWIRSIDWSDGTAVKEVCRFKFSAVTVTFISRKPDGTVAAVWPCTWRGLPNG